ncbi:MAG: hypothetical protein ACNI27_00860 [Desulfovibrio sp.]
MKEHLDEENLPEGVVQQKDGKYAIMPRIPLGVMPADLLITVTNIVQDYMLPSIKLTAGQRLMITGVDFEDIEDILERIGLAGYPTSQYVQSCAGSTTCKHGLQDSLCTAASVEMKLTDMGDTPAKIKIGISGCPRCCSESKLRDIGLIGLKKGWDIHFGGNAGHNPRVGDLIAHNMDMFEAMTVINLLLDYYKDNAKPRERTAKFVTRMGIDSIKEHIAQHAGFELNM